jgi:hypothetical protein
MMKSSPAVHVLGLLLLSGLARAVTGCGGDPEAASADRESPPIEGRDGSPDVGAERTAETIVVRGRVFTFGDTPLAGVPVLIGTHPIVLSDANGQFSVPGVSPPYTLTAIVSASKSVFVYEGLSRVDPVITATDDSMPVRRASLTGTLTGGSGYPEPPLTRTEVQLASGTFEYFAAGLSTSQSNAFSIPDAFSYWHGPTTIQGTLHALQYTYASEDDRRPTSYTGYGTIDVSVTNGVMKKDSAITLTPIAKATLTAIAKPPPEYLVSYRKLKLTKDERIIWTALHDDADDETLSYVLPRIGGAKAQVTVSANDSGSGAMSTTIVNGLEVDATNAEVRLLPAPRLGLPVDGATGVTKETAFSWSEFEGGVHVFVIAGEPGQPRYQIVTTATEVKIPDLSAAGIALPSAANYVWTVGGYAPFSSTDAYAGMNVLSSTSSPVLHQTQAPARSFTTAP